MPFLVASMTFKIFVFAIAWRMTGESTAKTTSCLSRRLHLFVISGVKIVDVRLRDVRLSRLTLFTPAGDLTPREFEPRA